MIIDTAALVLKSTTITTQAGIAVAVAKLLDSELLPDITTIAKCGDFPEGWAFDDEHTHPSERVGNTQAASVLSWLQLIAAAASGAIVGSYDSDEPVDERHKDEDDNSAQDGAGDDDVSSDVEKDSLEKEDDGDKYLGTIIEGDIVDDKLFKDIEEDKDEYLSYYH